MEAFTKESSSRMKYADMESTIGQMVNNMMGNGVIIKCMERAFSSGRIKRSIKAHLLMIKEKARVLLVGQMEDNMWENGKLVNSMEGEPT